MAFVALYEANVLYPGSFRDLLIRLGQTGLFQAKWTDEILDEVWGPPETPAAPMGQHVGVKRSTAIRHLVEMASEASESVSLGDSGIDWPLSELWVTGDLLDGGGELEVGAVILVLDVAAYEMPWLAKHPAGEWVGQRLRLGKRPMLWCYRPSVWLAWNAHDRRVARFWSADSGVSEAAIEALLSGADPGVEEPSDEELRAQLLVEREVSHACLRRIVDNYWERDWRREHRGHEAEDPLWRAAAGLMEIDDALAALDG